MRRNLAKLQGQRVVAAREVLELVGVAEELQPSVVLPNTRRKNIGVKEREQTECECSKKYPGVRIPPAAPPPGGAAPPAGPRVLAD